MLKLIVRRTVYALAIVGYVFVAFGCFSLLNQAEPPRYGQFPLLFAALVVLYFLQAPIIFAPLCVIAALKTRPLGLLFLYYVGLMYAGIWGVAVLGHMPLGIDAVPGLDYPWQEQLTYSFVFLAMWGVFNLVPTTLIWGVARFLVLRRQSS
jgi:hypothetical protein